MYNLFKDSKQQIYQKINVLPTMFSSINLNEKSLFKYGNNYLKVF